MRYPALLLLAFGLSAGCQNDGTAQSGTPPAAEATTAPESADGSGTPGPTAPTPTAFEPHTTTEASLLGEPQWATLFAGHDLDSFDMLGDAQWNIIDDYVEADGYTGSYLVTRGHYTDFRLQVEFWPSSDANSGVYIRCQNPNEINAESGYEINIFDQNENPDNRTGAIINHSAPLVATQAGGRWNTYDITAQGSRIVVRLNGTVVADIADDSFESGPIALQNNGGLIRFRNVRLTPL